MRICRQNLIRSQLKIIFKIVMSILVIPAVTVAYDPIVLPADWYELPETVSQENSNLWTSWFSFFSPAERAGEGEDSDQDKMPERLDRLLNDHSQALDRFSENLSTESPPPRASDRVPWHFHAFTTDLGLSLRGTLGVLLMKGESALSVIWKKSQAATGGAPQSRRSNIVEQAMEESAQISPEMTDRQLQTALDPVVGVAMASGRVSSEPTMRAELFKSARDFRSLVTVLQDNPGTPWWISRLRLDLLIDATGRILIIGEVGAAIRVRLEWFRVQKIATRGLTRASISRQFLSPQSSELYTFMSSLAADISAISEGAALQDTDYRASQFRIGLGKSVKGRLGIVKGSVGFLAHVYFTRDLSVTPRAGHFLAERVSLNRSPIFLIDDQPKPHVLEYARSNHIDYELGEDTNSNVVTDAVFSVDRDRFRRGLQKAIGIGGFFARRAQKNTPRRWGISAIKTGYDLSIEGKLAIVSLVGRVSTEIEFKNTQFR